MAQQVIDVGTVANDRTGDSWRDAFIKVNANETELFSSLSPDSIVWVTSEDNFPAPVSGISTLEDKVYILSNPDGFDCSFRLKFAFSGTVITSFGRLSNSMDFTNVSASANIINDTNISVTITGGIIRSPGAPLFSCVGGANALFTLSNTIIDDCSDIGTLNGFVRSQINTGDLIGFLVTGGLKFLGSSTTVIIEDIQSAANSVTPTFDMTDAGLSIINLSIGSCTASLLTGTNKFANIDPTKVQGGLITDCSFTSTDPLGTAIDNETPNIIVSRVGGVDDTRKIGEALLSPPQTVTIAVISTPVEIGGTWVDGSDLSQWSRLDPGVQYDGLDFGETFEIQADLGGNKAGSVGSNLYTFALYKNDVLVADSLAAQEVSDKGGSVTLSAYQRGVVATDHFTVYISNEDNTDNFEVTSAKIRAHRVN